MKRKISCALYTLLLVCLSGCAVGEDTAVSQDHGIISAVGGISEEENGYGEEVLPDIRSEADVSVEAAYPAGEIQ